MTSNTQERQQIVQRLRDLHRVNEEKQRKLQKEFEEASGGTAILEHVGFITKEACEIARLVPQMRHYGITTDELQ